MMAYEQQPQTEYNETSAEMRFAGAAFAVAAGLEIAAGLFDMSSMAAWDWIILWRGLSVGLVAAGVAYALALIISIAAPGLPALLLKKAEDVTGLDLDGKPNLPTGQPKREPRRMEAQPMVRQALQVEPLPLEDEADPFDELPQWIINTDKMIWADRLNINGKLIDIPQGFNDEWLYKVAEHRWHGKLPTISTVALHNIGIERFGNGDTPASMVLAVFEAAEIITRAGERQPYTWTDAGHRAFPCPNDNERQDG